MDIRLLLAGLREYSSMETLTPEVVNKITRRIEVHNSEIVDGHKRVGIDIHFTGVGLVDLRRVLFLYFSLKSVFILGQLC